MASVAGAEMVAGIRHRDVTRRIDGLSCSAIADSKVLRLCRRRQISA